MRQMFPARTTPNDEKPRRKVYTTAAGQKKPELNGYRHVVAANSLNLKPGLQSNQSNFR
jgi:hypothetical protein